MVLRAWDGILILMALGSFDISGCIFRALGVFLEAEACAGVLISCNNVEDGAGACAKLGVVLAVMAVVGVSIAGSFEGGFETFFPPVERAIP
jgi:hypothetical protein